MTYPVPEYTIQDNHAYPGGNGCASDIEERNQDGIESDVYDYAYANPLGRKTLVTGHV